jgi:hypothetical protein
METKYHIEITKRALGRYFSTEALETIITANIKQDRLAFMIGHDYIHFDGNSFTEGFRYIASQEAQVLFHLERSQYEQARTAFGCILHSWQDFYSHSNYVDLWLNRHPGVQPEEIVHADPIIFHHPELRSGKNYGVIEFFSMIPILTGLITPFMPADSHAKMNKDSPKAGSGFEYAYWGACKATFAAYENVMRLVHDMGFTETIGIRFTDK